MVKLIDTERQRSTGVYYEPMHVRRRVFRVCPNTMGFLQGDCFARSEERPI